jgi:Zinc carboxypeptidase
MRNYGNPCFGVDLNRNWGYEWGHNNGSSPDPCSELYRGPNAFSEAETTVLRDFIQARPWIRYVHDMHSYGQLMLYPWGYTAELPPGNETYWRLGARMSALAQAVHGRTYVYGPSYTTLYPVSGKLPDWAWGAVRAYSFTFELRGPGFNPPPTEIIPNSEEILPAALYLANFVIRPLSLPPPGLTSAAPARLRLQ